MLSKTITLADADAVVVAPPTQWDADAIKRYAIRKYCNLFKRLQKGHKDDYLDLLNMITFIDMCEDDLIPLEPLNGRKIFEYLNNK